MDIKKIASRLIEAYKSVVDNDLVKSCHGLIKFNGGLYKSEKQAKFFKYKINKGDRSDGKSGDVGTILGEQTQSGSMLGQWQFVMGEDGVREKNWLWWRWKEGKSKAEVDRIFDKMSDRERDRNWGLQDEMMRGEWIYGGVKNKWRR